jgi:hypothetical protein
MLHTIAGKFLKSSYFWLVKTSGCYSWEDQMDQPLYRAALYWNPNKYFDLKTDDVMAGKLSFAFTEVLAKMVPDQDLQNKINDQALEYEDLALATKLQSTTSKPSLLVSYSLTIQSEFFSFS